MMNNIFLKNLNKWIVPTAQKKSNKRLIYQAFMPMAYPIFLFIIISNIIFSSCNRTEKYSGYARTWTGIYYKIHSIGEEEIKPSVGDYITVDLLYKTLKDSVFFAGRRTFLLTKSDYRGSIDECFPILSKGDCATFILSSGSFFEKTLKSKVPSFLTAKDDMKIVVYMIDIMTNADFQKQKDEFLSWIDDFGEYESKLLKQYINEKQISIEPVNTGIYYLKTLEGNGKKVKKGNTITVNYEGRFLNGDYFDSTYKRKQPFEFKFGEQWQVIEGLEDAISMMTEGEKAIFVIPSTHAFGTSGSSTGIIPPFTSVIFEVELLKIE